MANVDPARSLVDRNTHRRTADRHGGHNLRRVYIGIDNNQATRPAADIDHVRGRVNSNHSGGDRAKLQCPDRAIRYFQDGQGTLRCVESVYELQSGIYGYGPDSGPTQPTPGDGLVGGIKHGNSVSGKVSCIEAFCRCVKRDVKTEDAKRDGTAQRFMRHIQNAETVARRIRYIGEAGDRIQGDRGGEPENRNGCLWGSRTGENAYRVPAAVDHVDEMGIRVNCNSFDQIVGLGAAIKSGEQRERG